MAYNKEYYKQYAIINKTKTRKYYKQYYKDNKEKIDERNEQYRKKNKEYFKQYSKQYKKNNKEKIQQRQKQYRKDNKEKINKYTNQCDKNNKKEYFRIYRKNKYKTTIKFNLNVKITTAIGCSLKGNKKGRKWETLVGYTCKDLIKRLNKTMPEGYTWQDYLEGKLHLDHKIPISKFNFTEPEHNDFQRCWALKNLQLLPKQENLEKHNKLIEPFQPTLAI